MLIQRARPNTAALARHAPRAHTRLTGRARLSAARSNSATVRPGPLVSSFLYLRPQSPPGLSAPPLSRCPAAPLHLRLRLDPPAALPHPFLACAPRTPSDPRRFRIRGRVIPQAQRPYRDSRDPNAEITGTRPFRPRALPCALPRPAAAAPTLAHRPALLCSAEPPAPPCPHPSTAPQPPSSRAEDPQSRRGDSQAKPARILLA